MPIADSATVVYERYLWSWDKSAYSTYRAIQGITADGRWFAVLMNCGNLVVTESPPAPLSPVGNVIHNCEAITGWAYDPNQTSKAVKVGLLIRLESSTADYDYIEALADLPDASSGVDGNHGFRFTIPSKWKHDSLRTVYTLVAFDASGGGQDIDLASTQYIDGPCSSAKPEPCPFNLALNKDDDNCTECPYQPNLWFKDSSCTPPPDKVEPCAYNASLDADDERCKVCPTDSNLWIDHEQCQEPFALIIYAKSARNITQEIADANNTTAHPGDVIEYHLLAQNVGNQSAPVTINEDLSDVLEYSTLIDQDGGQLDDDGKIMWAEIVLGAQQSIEKMIQIKIDKPISASPSPANNLESNNLELRNVFHDDLITIKVPRPVTKTPEVLAASLPNTGPGINTTISLVLIMMSTFFYSRNRQLAKELMLVKKTFSR
jgi:uncharacterized repeat protein (TIGR01451 family)